jgi:threonine aldolase
VRTPTNHGTKGHHLTLEDVSNFIVLDEDIHLYYSLCLPSFFSAELCCSCPTELIAIENTLSGSIFPQDEIVRISKYAHERGVKMHLDGARIWHAAIETATPLHVLSEPFDSVSACFSKGLGQYDRTCSNTSYIRDSLRLTKLPHFQVPPLGLV